MRIRIGLIGCIICMLNGLYVMGQPRYTAEQDVMYLRDGSVLRGAIIRQLPGQSVTLQTWDGTVFTYYNRDILRLTREPTPYRRIRYRYNKRAVPVSFREQGLYVVGTIGLATFQNRWGPQVIPNIHVRVEYRWRHYLELGIGTGLDGYAEGLVIPYYLHVGGDLKWGKRAWRPYYFGQGGYAHASTLSLRTIEYRGQFMGHLGVGLRRYTRTRKEISFTVGYKVQAVYHEFEEWIWQDRADPVVALVAGNRIYQRIVYQFQVAL
ncbi:MAG: hypothetical protein AAFV07_04095 [Bacteroidota bacterium]